jgi:hypothetical protein
MAKGVIGFPFTFSASFFDASGEPFVPVTPSIHAWYFSLLGERLTLIGEGTPMLMVWDTPNQYSYTVVIPSNLNPSTQIYAIMRGVDSISGYVAVLSVEVDLFAADSICPGIRTSFIP